MNLYTMAAEMFHVGDNLHSHRYLSSAGGNRFSDCPTRF